MVSLNLLCLFKPLHLLQTSFMHLCKLFSCCWWRGSSVRCTLCWHFVGPLWRTGRATQFRRNPSEFSSWSCRWHTTWMLDRYTFILLCHSQHWLSNQIQLWNPMSRFFSLFLNKVKIFIYLRILLWLLSHCFSYTWKLFLVVLTVYYT